MSITIDLVALYGTETLRLGQRFPTGHDATLFVLDYGLKNNKKLHVLSGGGRCNQYRCKSEGCKWSATVTREKTGPKDYKVTSLHDSHSDVCAVTADPTQGQLTRLSEFRVAVTSDNTVSKKTLIATVQATSKISLEQKVSKLYRAKDAIIAEHKGDYEESFQFIEPFLSEIEKQNLGSKVALECDQAGRFLRAFVCLRATVAALSMCQQIFGFDGAHFKQTKYTGRALVLVSRDGDNANFPVAFAVVSSENEANVRWFFDLCLDAGVPLHTTPETAPPIFCDRGVLLTVAKKMQDEKGIALNLKYCTIHILRNIKHEYRVRDPRLDNLVYAIQGAKNDAEYLAALTKLGEEYGHEVRDYVMRIPADKWCVHASTSKLYGWRSTNFVESHNAALDKTGVRRDSPYHALRMAVQQSMEAIVARANLYQTWVDADRMFTPFASKLRSREQQEAGAYKIHL